MSESSKDIVEETRRRASCCRWDTTQPRLQTRLAWVLSDFGFLLAELEFVIREGAPIQQHRSLCEVGGEWTLDTIRPSEPADEGSAYIIAAVGVRRFAI